MEVGVGSGRIINNLAKFNPKQIVGIEPSIAINIAKKNKEIGEIEVWQGKKKTIKTYINKDLYKTIPKARKKYLKITMMSLNSFVSKNTVLRDDQLKSL